MHFFSLRFILLLVLVLGGCSYVPDDTEPLKVTWQFIESVDQHQSERALSLLASDARSKIDDQSFAEANGDFQPIVTAFREAGIVRRAVPSHYEYAIRISRLRGHEGVVRFVMVQEGDQWRIANLIEEPK